MLAALEQLGVVIDSRHGGRTLEVNGTALTARHDRQPMELYVANSGTTIRFLTAFLSALGGHYRLHGVVRMHQRPIGELLDAVSMVVDGEVSAQSPQGCPPVLIHSRRWRGGQMTVGGNVSSQYLSGLLMAAPLASVATEIRVEGELVSKPYVQMTCEVMRHFGVEIESSPTLDHFMIPAAARYACEQYAIEPDASAASYFWAAAAITGGEVCVRGLSSQALQGDVAFVRVLEQMGCEVRDDGDSITVVGRPLRGVDVNMNAISDTVQTLAVVALFAEGPTRVRGVAHNRFKETDRIADLACELRKLGAEVEEADDGLCIEPLKSAQQQTFGGATLATYHDHRMAMSLSLAGLRLPGVQIQNPSCTAKTYPDYFADLEKLIGRPHHWRNYSTETASPD